MRARRLNRFKIIDYGLADFTEYYPSGHVSVGGPTHAVPKVGPLHLSLGKLQMALPLPISAEQLKRIPQASFLACSPALLLPVPQPVRTRRPPDSRRLILRLAICQFSAVR